MDPHPATRSSQASLLARIRKWDEQYQGLSHSKSETESMLARMKVKKMGYKAVCTHDSILFFKKVICIWIFIYNHKTKSGRTQLDVNNGSLKTMRTKINIFSSLCHCMFSKLPRSFFRKG